MKSKRYKKAESGIALLTVLFILVLMTTLMAYLIEDEYLALRRVVNHRDYEQIYQMMVGNEQWAAKVLERDMRQNGTDHLNELWHNLLPETQVDEGKMAAVVIDMQGKFNLNNLKTRGDAWYAVFQRLLRVLELDEGLADAVLDWIDTDSDVTGNRGAEDQEYLLKTPAYRSANRGFGSVGELLWVEGFDAAIVGVLAPYVTALPVDKVRINVNTASLQLLRAITKDILSEAEAESLVIGRGEEGYKNNDDFLVMTELAGRSEEVAPLIAVSSLYFEVQGRAQYGRLNGAIYSILEKIPSTQQVRVVYRWRGFS
ncbi:type II secretion system minor pseudopilin GspK [Gammaproteobacteria bacterium]|nr:type II secretion system minor pseudopilin GspK [Gammaproteobacteria bacterium]